MSSQPLNRSQSGASERLKFVPAQVLIERKKELDTMIARRAYAIFELRGAAPGQDADDWLWAESELLYPCRHDLEDLPAAIILKAETRGNFTVDEIELSIEPRRLIVGGKKMVDVIYGDRRGSHFERMSERVFHTHDLPVEIDPSRTTATLRAETLEVIMPKAATADRTMGRGEAL